MGKATMTPLERVSAPNARATAEARAIWVRMLASIAFEAALADLEMEQGDREIAAKHADPSNGERRA